MQNKEIHNNDIDDKRVHNKAIHVALFAFLSIAMLTSCGKQATVSDSNDITSDTISETTVENGEDKQITTESSENQQTSTENSENQQVTFENLPPLNIIDDKYRTTYEIFVYSFYDSDGDGIGDLQGVIDKLDYVNDGDDSTDTDLGCNEIWLMPISPSPTYHKYDITDYKDIDPQYGTLEDFDNLVKECHSRGVNIIIDLVLNHTSSEHPWFKEAAEYLRNHPELEKIYNENKLDGNKTGKDESQTDSGNSNNGDTQTIDDFEMSVIPELAEECPYLYYYNFSTNQQTDYEKLPGTNWYYEARFWSGMPDLNLDNPQVKEEIADITQFWIDRGVDGFRLDAVTSYYTDNDTKNIEFMTWLNDTVKSQKEDAYMVGEGWAALSRYSKYYVSGIDSFFAFEFAGSEGAIGGVARSKRKPIAYAEAIANAEKELASVREDYVDAPFFTNHDTPRAAGYFVGRGSEKMVKMAGALNLLMGGNAFIYYGEELGMKGSGKDENKRAPMLWTSDADAEGMCDGPKDMEKVEMTYPSLLEQAQDPYSIYNYYKKAIRLRNTYPVIARGKTQPIEALSDDDIGAFVRYGNTGLSSDSHDYIVFNDNGENIGLDGATAPVLGAKDPLYGEAALLIIINNGDEAKTVDLSKWSGTGTSPELAYELNVGEERSSLEGTSLTVPSYGIVVVK